MLKVPSLLRKVKIAAVLTYVVTTNYEYGTEYQQHPPPARHHSQKTTTKSVNSLATLSSLRLDLCGEKCAGDHAPQISTPVVSLLQHDSTSCEPNFTQNPGPRKQQLHPSPQQPGEATYEPAPPGTCTSHLPTPHAYMRFFVFRGST